MTAYVKSENVTGWAGLWLRIDQDEPQKTLSFDNMYNRSIRGTTKWTKYEIILDVPVDATKMVYGALLNKGGQIWIDDISFELLENLDEENAYVDPDRTYKNMTEPLNLNFDEYQTGVTAPESVFNYLENKIIPGL